MAKRFSKDARPAFPRRAIVTAGEPYGNKGLHFGHVGGVFVPADFYARFLRDRIGRENVIFTSGTDCYGSPIMEGYRKRVESEGYDKSITDYVQENHDKQAKTLENFQISCDIYGGSALEPAASVHERITDEIIGRLQERGVIEKLSTKQFYDAEAGQFLNGRQVIGRCPIQGCKSEKAYADECDLGHQYEPEELIDIVFTVDDQHLAMSFDLGDIPFEKGSADDPTAVYTDLILASVCDTYEKREHPAALLLDLRADV